MQILSCPSLAYKSLPAPGMRKMGPRLRLICSHLKIFQQVSKDSSRIERPSTVHPASITPKLPEQPSSSQTRATATSQTRFPFSHVSPATTHESYLSANHSSLFSQNKTHHFQPGIPCQSYFPLSISQMHSYLFPPLACPRKQS